MLRLTTLRAVTALAVLGAMTLAGCGGGGSKSVGPLPTTSGSNPGTTTQTNSGSTTGYLSVTLPNTTSGATAQSTKRAILSSAKKPTFIDTTTANSAIVVAVTPEDPAEAAQYGNLTICYNLYTNGTLDASNPPNFVVTAVGNTASTVTVAIPAPPGTDGFQITQYGGQCGSTPYTLPTPPPTNVGSSNVLAQTPVTLAYMSPGQQNNLNVQIADCEPPAVVTTPVPPAPCPSTYGGVTSATLAASVTIAKVLFGALPIPNPIREQGFFLFSGDKIGVPIPLEAEDSSGAVIPGLTTPTVPLGGAGMFPSGVTVTTGDAVNTSLYLVDAATGAIAQGPGTSVTIHEFNALSDNTIAGYMNDCGTGAQSCQDTLLGGNGGDPWVIVLAYNGADASKVASVTVTASATVANAALATPVTTTITPQSAVFSAVSGYADAAAPAAPLALIQPTAAGPVFFTDGNVVKQDGVNTPSAAEGTTLTGLTYANYATPALYAVDNSVAGGNLAPSGLYTFNPAALGGSGTAITTQDSNLNLVQFAHPVGAIYAADLHGGSKLYVIDANGIEIVDVNTTTNIASNVGPCTVTGTPLAAAPSGVKLLGTAVSTNANESFWVADPGNSRIAQVAVNQFNCTITTYASGQPFTGLTSLGSGALYATSSSGQIYYISSSGTVTSLGLTTAAAGATKDGPIGQLSALGSAPTGTLSPVTYLEQLVAGSFFNTAGVPTGLAAPYTLAPFTAAPNSGKAFAVAPAIAGLVADTSASAPATAGTFDATGGLIVYPTSATPTAAGVITPDSILFVDGGTKLRTVVR